METEKKQWTKPELIVLVRNKPEEAVLQACKAQVGGGPEGEYWVCAWWAGFCVPCKVVDGS